MATEAELRKSVATWMDQYVGIKEGSTEHKAIIALFNESKLCTRYKMTTSDAWCATAVSAAFIASGLTSIFPCVECSCAQMITLAQKAGIWTELDSYKPSQGDVIMYDWDDSGSGDNTGTPDHVGIVYSVSGSSFKVIEGNKSDTVGYRDMKVNGQYIRGYITPDYASVATTAAATTSTSESTTDESAPSKTVQWTGTINTKTVPRKWAGTSYGALSSVSSLAKGTEVGVCDTVKDTSGTEWYYVLINSKYYGFVPAANVTKPSTTSSSSSSTPNKTVQWTGVVKTSGSNLNVRTWAGTENATIKKYPSIKNGTKVGVCDTVKAEDGSSWYYILIANTTYGFVSSSYIVKA